MFRIRFAPCRDNLRQITCYRPETNTIVRMMVAALHRRYVRRVAQQVRQRAGGRRGHRLARLPRGHDAGPPGRHRGQEARQKPPGGLGQQPLPGRQVNMIDSCANREH